MHESERRGLRRSLRTLSPQSRNLLSRVHEASRRVLLTGLLGCLAAAPAWAQESEGVYEDEEVKAAFIYHFATFVEWPPAGEGRVDFRVAVIGDDLVAAELERFLPGRDIGGRPMRVERLDSLDELGEVDVLYVGAGYDGRLAQVAAVVGDRPVLIVTDAPDALSEGSMINFEVVDERVRFEISLTAAQRAGLDLSSRLLSAAMFVDTQSALPRVSGTPTIMAALL
ncbi:MAG TPA: YfiR family protein [Woeseiaceae bacterium]|nr:YfiR family protein [Woeseiaceae bacterium]